MRSKAVNISKARGTPFLPPSQRKQIYLPEFVIALVRTPHLSANYAQFRVPLNFNKLDMRDYLQNLYGVSVIEVRSFIQQQPITRMTRDGRNLGPWRRPQSQKRMTVQLKEPFVWPEEPKDTSKWEKDSWDATEKIQSQIMKKNTPKGHSAEEPDHKVRKAFEEQAKKLRENKETWKPTWKTLGLDFAHKEFAANVGSNRPKWAKS
ncbi:54S ribosomal protein [Penicillium taxi]|uniref:54S ribosomal protein n=1 Tax=Penicillium taxi TaxID=168475 RepID=UPI002544F5CE|nr:54S ribosomal protein [Penicillium taxi]KAJ5893551.1 54S ribosomal protein [Penicillium taxi]